MGGGGGGCVSSEPPEPLMVTGLSSYMYEQECEVTIAIGYRIFKLMSVIRNEFFKKGCVQMFWLHNFTRVFHNARYYIMLLITTC